MRLMVFWERSAAAFTLPFLYGMNAVQGELAATKLHIFSQANLIGKRLTHMPEILQ